MGKVLRLVGVEEYEMSTIWDKVKFNPYERPKYTKYEISKLILSKREEEKLTLHEFAKKYDVTESVLKQIEDAKRSFNVNMYKVCSKILGLSIHELLQMDTESQLCVSYRKADKCVDNDVEETVEFANFVFNEMVMQRKINTRG